MNQVAGNIFDMLLGFDPVASGNGQQQAGAVGQTGGPAFDAILASLLGSGVTPNQMSDGQTSPLMAMVGQQTKVDDSSLLSTTGQPLDVLLQQLMLGGNEVPVVLADQDGDEPTQAMSTADAPKEQTVLKSIIPDKNEVKFADDARQFLNLPNRHIGLAQMQAMPDIAPVDGMNLDSAGLYRIVDAKVEGNVVRLDLVAADDITAQPVQITLPKEQLANLTIPNSTVADKRIPISGMTTNDNKVAQTIDSLLQKLNFVELKITEPQVTTTQAAKPVEIGATINNSANLTTAAEPVLTLTIDRRLLQPEKPLRTDGLVADSKKDSVDGLILKNNVTNMTALQPRELPTMAERMQKAVSEGLDRLLQNPRMTDQTGGNKAEARDLTHLGFMTDRSISLDPNTQLINKPAHVRFTLPENLNTMLRPHGEAVMLKIQPDHLGPAKLYLEMKDGALHARVSVETVAARHAVEGSLDRLIDQLQQQNIRVDRIEVTLHNENGRHQFFDRRSQHPHFKSASNGHNDDDEEVLMATSGVAARAAAPAYMSARGLNLYA